MLTRNVSDDANPVSMIIIMRPKAHAAKVTLKVSEFQWVTFSVAKNIVMIIFFTFTFVFFH